MTLFLEGSTGRSKKKYHQKSSKTNWQWFPKITYQNGMEQNTAEKETLKIVEILVEINSSCISWEENTLKQITTHTLCTQPHTTLSLGPPSFKNANFNSKTKIKLQHKHTHTPSKGGGDVKILLFRPTLSIKQIS